MTVLYRGVFFFVEVTKFEAAAYIQLLDLMEEICVLNGTLSVYFFCQQTNGGCQKLSASVFEFLLPAMVMLGEVQRNTEKFLISLHIRRLIFII